MSTKEFCAIQLLNDIVGPNINAEKSYVSQGTYNLHICDLQRQHALEIQTLKDRHATKLHEELEDQAQRYVIQIQKLKKSITPLSGTD